MKARLTVIGLLVVLVLCTIPVSAEQPIVSTFFYETDIREAINELVLQTGVNIIPDDTVRGTVTLDLEDVPFERALTMMLISGGFTYRKIDDYYVVGLPDPRGQVFQHLAETTTIRLQNMTAGEASDLLPAHYDRYLRSSRDGQMLTITAPADVIEKFLVDVEQIDLPQEQVIIKAIVTEVSTEVYNQWGANMFEMNLGRKDNYTEDWTTIFGFATDTLSVDTDFFGGILTSLRALEGDQKAQIQANPRIMVADRSTANLFVGDTQHIILEPTGGTARLEKVDVGVAMEVTPRIMADGELMLTISPEISHLTSEGTKGLVVRRSELSTSVFVQDGQTIMLAGMTRDSQALANKKFPVLGNIPILRWFFSESSESEAERELLVFITAEVVQRGALND